MLAPSERPLVAIKPLEWSPTIRNYRVRVNTLSDGCVKLPKTARHPHHHPPVLALDNRA